MLLPVLEILRFRTDTVLYSQMGGMHGLQGPPAGFLKFSPKPKGT